MTGTVKAVNDEELAFAAGGNYGDAKFEHDRGVVLYKVGDTVEVFDSELHFCTTRGTIIKIDTARIRNSIFDYCMITVPYYLVKLENGVKKWAISDDIERR